MTESRTQIIVVQNLNPGLDLDIFCGCESTLSEDFSQIRPHI